MPALFTMKHNLPFCVLCAALLVPAADSRAHHSFAAEFDADAPVSFVGTLTRFDLVAPHSWIYVDVEDESGTLTNWAIELGVPNMLIRQGVTKSTLTPGTIVHVEGFRARDGSPTAAGGDVTFDDGRPIFSSPGRR